MSNELAFAVAMLVMAVFLVGLLIFLTNMHTQNWLDEIKKEEARKDEIAKELCATQHFYDSNFDRCERLEIRPE